MLVEGWMINDEDEKPDVSFTLRGVTADYPGHQVALALVDNYRGISRCVGSGVAVAPGLAMTASHVIDGCIRYRQQVDGYRHSDQLLSLTAVQSYDNKVFVWSVDFIYGSVLSDIAFLRFARPVWWGDGPGQAKPAFARLNLNKNCTLGTLLLLGSGGCASPFYTACVSATRASDHGAANMGSTFAELEGTKTQR